MVVLFSIHNIESKNKIGLRAKILRLQTLGEHRL